VRLRIIEYLGYLGGVERFFTQVLWQLIEAHSDIEIELVSYGPALDMYRQRFASMGVQIRLLEIKPSNYWRAQSPPFIFGIRGTSLLQHLLGAGTEGYFDVPSIAFDGCDVVWFPAIARHRIQAACAHRTVGTLHDIIPLQIKDVFPPKVCEDERETTRRWLTCGAHIALTSQATKAALEDVFGVSVDRSTVVPILAKHERIRATQNLPIEYQWAQHPFLICPANMSPHKNHAVLVKGVAEWGAKHPLVLSGWMSDLQSVGMKSIENLRQLIEDQRFTLGKSLIPLGYIDAPLYQALLTHSWAMVMPTLAEGGGNYPVLEAMLAGIPVVCSDIPVMREHIERTGGQVLWFDPHDPRDLASRLHDLEENYEHYKAQAVEQVNGLHVNSWKDVAASYWRIMTTIAIDKKLERKEVLYV